MDYLEYFGLSAEPFSHAPVSRFYYASRQHTEALKRLLYATQTMKGLAILIGDIGHGKTTLARRLLDALPQDEFEAAMLVVVHAGVTANWLLKRIAQQLGVAEPADDKLTILSQLYARLVEIHESGKRAVVLIDEAQMLGTRELMEEFRGLLNLEVPGHKLVSFVFFGLPDIERNLLLDPALAQRVALRYHLKPLGVEETVAYVTHRLKLAGAKDELLPRPAIVEVHRLARGVPRVINTLCDNVLLELFFAKLAAATPEVVLTAAENLGLAGRELTPPAPAAPLVDIPAAPGSAGEDAVVVIRRSPGGAALARADATAVDADGIASRVAEEGGTPANRGNGAGDIADPLAFLPRTDLMPPPAAASAALDGPGDEEVEVTFDASPDAGASAATAESSSPLVLPDLDPALIKPRLVVPAPPASTLGDEGLPEPLLGPGDLSAPLPAVSSRPLPGPLVTPPKPAPASRPAMTGPGSLAAAFADSIGTGSPGALAPARPPRPNPPDLPAPLPASVPPSPLPTPSAAARAFAEALGVPTPASPISEVKTPVATPAPRAAPPARPSPPPSATAPASRAIVTGAGSIDLDAIDDLLADIKKR